MLLFSLPALEEVGGTIAITRNSKLIVLDAFATALRNASGGVTISS